MHRLQSRLFMFLIFILPSFVQAMNFEEMRSWLKEAGGDIQRELTEESFFPVRLGNKEDAFIAAVSSAGGRNYHINYALFRPKLRQARLLEGFTPDDCYERIGDYENGTIFRLSSSASGGGSYETSDQIVIIDGWDVVVLVKATIASNSGWCDGSKERSCQWSQSFINQLDKYEANGGELRYLVTSVEEGSHQDRKVTYKIHTIPTGKKYDLGFIKEIIYEEELALQTGYPVEEECRSVE